MHHLDLGLYNYQVTFTRYLLREWCGSIGVAEFDGRLATAAEYRAMMRQLLFVVDGIIEKLHKSSYTANQAKNMNKQLVELYVDWNRMYIFSRKDEFTESDLQTFKACCCL